MCTLNMIKAKHNDLVILGITDENIKRMRAGQPMFFNLKDLGLPNQQVMILTGETEGDIYKTLTGRDLHNELAHKEETLN